MSIPLRPDPIDLSDPINEICKRLGVSADYVSRIDLHPGEAEVVLFRGSDGRCEGSKHVDTDTGTPARDIVSFAIRS